jgi:hypothetical protein
MSTFQYRKLPALEILIVVAFVALSMEVRISLPAPDWRSLTEMVRVQLPETEIVMAPAVTAKAKKAGKIKANRVV